jgi:hypothetical protein
VKDMLRLGVVDLEKRAKKWWPLAVKGSVEVLEEQASY